MSKEYYTENLSTETLAKLTDEMLRFEKNKKNKGVKRSMNIMLKLIPVAAAFALVIGLVNNTSIFSNINTGDEINPATNITEKNTIESTTINLNENLEEDETGKNSGSNWYEYFYDNTYGWSWSPQYIGKFHGQDGKQLTVRINPDYADKFEGFDYDGSGLISNGVVSSYGIEIYTPNGVKIKTYDTVQINEKGDIIIGGDTIINLNGTVTQAGNSEFMIGKRDGAIIDGKGNIIPDEVINREIETYGSTDDWSIWNDYNQESAIDNQTEALNQQSDNWGNYPWKEYTTSTNHIKEFDDGTKITLIADGILNQTHNLGSNSVFYFGDEGTIKLPDGTKI